MLDVLNKVETGPICTERDFDLKILAPKIKELTKAYEIKYGPENPVPADDSLADAVFNAALDLYLESGTLCVSNQRRIIFEDSEIKEALKGAPRKVAFGEGRDLRVMTNRRIGDPDPPFCLNSGGCSISEEVYVKVIQSIVQNPLADTASGGLGLDTIYGVRPKADSPTEILASIWNVILIKEAARRAGRPGIGFHNVHGTGLTDASFIAAYRPEFGVGPGDGAAIASLAELKTDYNTLNKAVYFVQADSHLGNIYVPLMGGYAGGAEGTAIVSLAHHLQGLLVHQADYSDLAPLHMRYSCTTTRETLWVASVVGQALSRNTHLLTACESITAAGPCTEMVLLETAAMSTVGAASGININNASAAKSQYLDRNTGMECEFGSEVGHATAGMSRADANELVRELLLRYEDKTEKPPLGRTFQECYDLKTVKPTKEHLEIYDRTRKQLEDLGLNLSGDVAD
jgi:methylamine--corrinoid protein Co-methyltransferase